MNPSSVNHHRRFLKERYNVSLPQRNPSRFEKHLEKNQQDEFSTTAAKTTTTTTDRTRKTSKTQRESQNASSKATNQQQRSTSQRVNSPSTKRVSTPSAIMSPHRKRQIREKHQRVAHQQQQMLALDGGGTLSPRHDHPHHTLRPSSPSYLNQQRNLSQFAYNTLRPTDFNRGLLHLQIQKKLPPQLDLTDIIHSSPSPVQIARKPIRSALERTAGADRSANAAAIATERENFSLWNVKLDLVNETGVTFKDKMQTQQLSDDGRRPFSQSIVSINEQQKQYIYASSDEDDEEEYYEEQQEEEIQLETDELQQEEDSQPALEEEDARKDRGYEELMDEFSLHHIIIRRGKLLSSTPEFISYQRTFQYMWGSILTVLKMLERLMNRFDVPLAFIDGKKVALLAKNEARKPKVEELLNCIVNYDAVISKISIPQSKFKGKNGPYFAAVTIQKTWKMYKTRKMYLRLRQQDRHALVIQRYWRLKQAFLNAKQDAEDEFDEQLIRWHKRMQYFKQNWKNLRTSRRLVVYVPSWSYEEQQRKTIPKMRLMQMAQVAALMDLADPQLEMLLVTPYPMNDEAHDYMMRLLNLSGVKNPEKRLKCLHPENWQFLPQYMSLTDCLLCSPRTLKYIKTMVAGRDAYLMPNVCSQSELQLAVKLQLPLLGPDPQKSLIYSTKSGSKRIFLQADVNTAPCEYDLYEETELFLHLSKRIVDHPQYNTWLIKIDHEFSSRGIASLEIDRLKSLSEQGRRDLIEELEESNQQDHYLESLRERLYMELRESLSKHARIISKYAYPNWESFIKGIQQHGAIIEAVPNEVLGYPSVNLFIEPNGEIQMDSIQEQLISPEYVSIGAAFPQVTVPSKALYDASKAVARVLYEKDIFGYVSVEFVAWVTENQALKIWAVDLKLRRTENALMHRVFEVLTHGSCIEREEDQHDGNDASQPSSYYPLGAYRSEVHSYNNLSYIYSGIMRHAEFSMWRHEDFFAACREKDLMFDARMCRGVIFHLLDNLIEGAFGALCIGHSSSEAISIFEKTILFISNQIEDRKSFLDPIGMENSFQCAFQLNQNFQERRQQMEKDG